MSAALRDMTICEWEEGNVGGEEWRLTERIKNLLC